MSSHPGADGLVQDERTAHLTWILLVFTSLACYPGAFRERGGLSSPVPRGDHLPLLAAWSSLLASHWRYLPRQQDGTTAGRLDLPSPSPACATPSPKGAGTHAGSGPSRVRRLFWTCLGNPILGCPPNVRLPKIDKISPAEVDFSPHYPQKNQNPETIPICIAVPCFPHDSVACNHSCGEGKKSNEPSVCHKLWSIW